MKIEYKTNVADLSPPVAAALTLFFNLKKILIMKKSFFFFPCFVIAMICITNASGQVNKGNWLVGGNFAYAKSNSSGIDATNSKGRSIEIASNIGYFVFDKFATGIKINSQFTKEKYPQVNGSYTSQFQNIVGLGPFIRYYFLKPDNRINVFSDAAFLYSVYSNNNAGSTQKSIDYTMAAGAAIFFNTTVSMEFLLDYKNSNTLKFDAKEEKIAFKIGFQIHLENN